VARISSDNSAGGITEALSGLAPGLSAPLACHADSRAAQPGPRKPLAVGRALKQQAHIDRSGSTGAPGRRRKDAGQTRADRGTSERVVAVAAGGRAPEKRVSVAALHPAEARVRGAGSADRSARDTGGASWVTPCGSLTDARELVVRAGVSVGSERPQDVT